MESKPLKSCSTIQKPITISADIGPAIDVVDVRRRVGMVFQRPNPFPKSIFDNVTYGPRLYGVRKKSDLDDIAEKSLRSAALWDEVKDKLNESGMRQVFNFLDQRCAILRGG